MNPNPTAETAPARALKDEPVHAPPYWTTSVSRVTDSKVYIRGFDLEEIIGRLPFSAAVYLMIRDRIPTPAETDLLDTVLSAILDYSLQKSGTVAARYIASANPNMAAALAASVLGIGKNTMDPSETAKFCLDAHARLEAEGGDPAELAQRIVEEMRARKERIPGLGHPVFRYTDPRAQKLREKAVASGRWGPRAEFFEEIHRAFTRLPGKESIVLNDIGMMGLVLVEMGFSPEETTGLAVLSTLPGVIAHVAEEFRAGKPIRVVPDATAHYDVPTRNFEQERSASGWGAE